MTGPRAWREAEGLAELAVSLSGSQREDRSQGVPTSQRLQSLAEEVELGLVLWAIAHTSGQRRCGFWVEPRGTWLAGARKVCPGVKGPAHLHSLLSESFSQRLPCWGLSHQGPRLPQGGPSYLCTLDSPRLGCL